MRRALVVAALWAAGAVLCTAGSGGAAPVYKCVDAKGFTQYSEKPVPGCRGTEVDIQPLPPPSGAERPESRDLAEQERGFKRRQIEREEAEKQAASEMQQRAKRCQQVQSELSRYTNSRRVVQADAKGERSFMPDDERDRRIAALQGEVAKNCR